MRRVIPIVLFALAVSTSLLAQRGRGAAPPAPPPALEPGASQADVDKALIAAPAPLRDQATVIKWKPDFTYDTLRKGTNVSSATTGRAFRSSSRSRFNARASPTWTARLRI